MLDSPQKSSMHYGGVCLHHDVRNVRQDTLCISVQGTSEDGARGITRKDQTELDRLLTCGALPRDAPLAAAPPSLQSHPKRFQLQVLQPRPPMLHILLYICLDPGPSTWRMSPFFCVRHASSRADFFISSNIWW